MDQKQRIAHQRALARQAVGLLNAATEYFGAEDSCVLDVSATDYEEWREGVKAFERWLWDESPIA